MRKAVVFCVKVGLFLSVCDPTIYGASRPPVYGHKGMVVSTSDLASEIGAKVLREGGNAADATVAVALALAVTWPSAGNLGGGGFALIRLPSGEAHFVDYREVAPISAGEDFYLDSLGQVVPRASTIGRKAAGVPGTPAGLELIHKRWGRMPWARLVEPARLLAEKGYLLNYHHARAIRQSRELLQTFPETRQIFFPKGKDPEEGDLFVQKDLAKTLAALKKDGAKAFYKGPIGKLFVADQKRNGGAITLDDLAAYQVHVRKPLRGSFRGYEVMTAPPPSSGGATLLQMLGMLENDPLQDLGVGSSSYIHLLVETMRRAFADRSQWYGDPDFVDVPIASLLKPEYLKGRRSEIDPARASTSQAVRPGEHADGEKHETTHFTVMDDSGFVVSNTYTLNGSFGSGAIAAGTGILLNNEMDDFAVKPGTPNMFGLIQGPRNKIAPKKRPLSSMTPTSFVKDHQPVLALGSPGGPTIINTVLQVSLNILVHDYDVQAAVDEPRFHHQWLPDEITWEPRGLNPDARARLKDMGHVFSDNGRYFGDSNGIVFDQRKHLYMGGADSRLGGKAVAP